MNRFFFSIVLILAITACDRYTPGSLITDAIKAHRTKAFAKKKGIEVDFVLHLTDGDSINGTMTWLSKEKIGLLHLGNGLNLVQSEAGVVQMGKEVPEEFRLDFRPEAWMELLILPFKLDHPEWRKSEYLRPLPGDNLFRAKKLHVTARGKEQERLVYVHPETHLVHAVVMADDERSVDNGKTRFAVEFADPMERGGMIIHRIWKFKNWHPKNGLMQEKGELIMREVRFVDQPDGYQERWMVRYTHD
jgi:hypothetical protein